MNKNYTDLTIVLDRSGSMASCKVEAETGIRTLIEEQRKDPGTTLLSLLQFDTANDWVYKAQNVHDINAEKFKLEPRGMTALYDAIGIAIQTTGERLAAMNEEDRPGLVTLVIVTDGLENSSQEYNVNKVREMIERQQTQYSWKFSFLGANQDAIMTGSLMGISAQSSATYSVGKSSNMLRAASSNVSRMKAAMSVGDVAHCVYTADERADMNE